MSAPKGCGNCNYQGDSKHTGEKELVFCLFHNTWNNSNYICVEWATYSYHLSNSDRFMIAKDAKQSKVLLKQEKLSKVESSKDRRFKIFLVVLSVLLGIAATLLTQWLGKIIF